jgi:5'-nucleotidase
VNLLVDMDGVLADIEKAFWKAWHGTYIAPEDRQEFYIISDLPEEERAAAWELMKDPGFFVSMPPIPGALAGIVKLRDFGHDVRIVTKPIRSSRFCASEKQLWVKRWLGKEWLECLVITSDKTVVRGDYLLDDAPYVDGSFAPLWQHIRFGSVLYPDWDAVVKAWT